MTLGIAVGCEPRCRPAVAAGERHARARAQVGTKATATRARRSRSALPTAMSAIAHEWTRAGDRDARRTVTNDKANGTRTKDVTYTGKDGAQRARPIRTDAAHRHRLFARHDIHRQKRQYRDARGRRHGRSRGRYAHEGSDLYRQGRRDTHGRYDDAAHRHRLLARHDVHRQEWQYRNARGRRHGRSRSRYAFADVTYTGRDGIWSAPSTVTRSAPPMADDRTTVTTVRMGVDDAGSRGRSRRGDPFDDQDGDAEHTPLGRVTSAERPSGQRDSHGKLL